MARFRIECCRDCLDRFPGCHGQCEKYKQERAEYEETMAAKRREQDLKNGLNDFLYDSIERTNKHINYRSKYRRKR